MLAARLPILARVLFLFAFIGLIGVGAAQRLADEPPSPQRLTQPIVRGGGDEDAPGPDPRPSEWHWLRRTYPHWKADADALSEASVKARSMKAAAPIRKQMNVVQFAGPTNIGGRIVDIEYDPTNPSIVYAGAATGGVFKSVDGGVSWAPIFDDAANLSAGDIAVDPNAPHVVWVGTGEPNGGHNNFPGGGLYRSTDSGANWQLVGLENTVSIGRVVVDPSNSDRIFVAAVGSYFGPNPERGLYRSTDGGTSFGQSLAISDSTGAIDVIVDPSNSNRVMAAMWERVRRPNSSHLFGPTSGIHRSLDGGDSWMLLGPGTGLPDAALQNVGRIGLAQSGSNPDVVYALITDGNSLVGLYRSDDFGDTWIDVDTDDELDAGTFGFSWYFGQVRVRPDDPDVVYVLDVSFMRSTNQGSDWPIVYGYSGSPADFHVDHHALAIHPTNHDILIEGNDGGINLSSDAGVSWTKVADLPVTQFYEIALDAQLPWRLYGGTQDNGTLRTPGGFTDDWERIWGGDGFYCLVDPSDSDRLYAESQFGGLVFTDDGGLNWYDGLNGIDFEQPTNWSTPVVMDPQDSQVLYYGTDRLYRTTDGAASWNPISGDLTNGDPAARLGTLTTIGVSPQDSQILWVGTDDAHVWVTSDLGANWTDVSAALPKRWVTRVVPDPLDPATCYVTFNGLKWKEPQPHVYRTTDLGASWADISNNLPDAPVNGFAVHPVAHRFLFVGTDLGAYSSGDYGASWQYLASNLPLVSVYDLKIHPTANYLAIGTHGRSMYTLDLETVVGADVAPSVARGVRLEQNHPNPFNPSTSIAFTLDAREHTRLRVHDAVGRVVSTLVEGPLDAGPHRIEWDGRDGAGRRVASGTYFYRIELRQSGGTATRKMTLIK